MGPAQAYNPEGGGSPSSFNQQLAGGMYGFMRQNPGLLGMLLGGQGPQELDEDGNPIQARQYDRVGRDPSGRGWGDEASEMMRHSQAPRQFSQNDPFTDYKTRQDYRMPQNNGFLQTHFNNNRGGPVDSDFEPNYNQGGSGGGYDPPRMRDYAGTSGGGMY